MLNYLRNDNSWTALSSDTGVSIRTPELRELCNAFEKSYRRNEDIENNSVTLNFIYDEENDCYVVYMLLGLERDPPPRTS